MPRIPLIVAFGLALTCAAMAQTPPATSPGATINLTLQDAMQRARQYSQQVYSANIAALLAHEDTVQAKAALLPTADAAKRVHLHAAQRHARAASSSPTTARASTPNSSTLHADIYNPVKRAEYRRTMAAEAVAKAKADLAARGLVATVTQNFYGMAVAQRKVANAQASLREARDFQDLTRKAGARRRGGQGGRGQGAAAGAAARARSAGRAGRRWTKRASVSR